MISIYPITLIIPVVYHMHATPAYHIHAKVALLFLLDVLFLRTFIRYSWHACVFSSHEAIFDHLALPKSSFIIRTVLRSELVYHNCLNITSCVS